MLAGYNSIIGGKHRSSPNELGGPPLSSSPFGGKFLATFSLVAKGHLTKGDFFYIYHTSTVYGNYSHETGTEKETHFFSLYSCKKLCVIYHLK
jgi:hypothetical protein